MRTKSQSAWTKLLLSVCTIALIVRCADVAHATNILAQTALDFEIGVPASIEHVFSEQLRIFTDEKSPERAITTVVPGTFSAKAGGNFNYRVENGWRTVAQIFDPSVGDFAFVTSSYQVRLAFANQTNSAATFFVTPDWDPSLNITSNPNPDDLVQLFDIVAVSYFSISVRDQDGNIPTNWADVSHDISFGQAGYFTPGIRPILFTVPARNNSKSLTFDFVTTAGIRVLPEPSAVILLVTGLVVGAIHVCLLRIGRYLWAAAHLRQR